MSLSENLYNLGALMKTNLEKKGVTGLTGNEGLTTLANKILDIECNSSSKNIVANFTGDSISLGGNGYTWLTSAEDVVIDWGDGTSDTVNNPSTKLSHTYTDGLSEHTVRFIDNVTKIGSDCFKGCSGLTNIIIPDSVTSLGSNCFYGCSDLTSIIIPDSVTSLGSACFYGCSSLTSIIIPNSITSLVSACFYGCSGLTSVIIPNSITSLESHCFYMCSGLTSIIIPDSVTSLKSNCFDGCTGLIDYELYWETQPIPYNSTNMPTNRTTVFTIPFGTALIYADAGYPLDSLIEREST